MTQTMPDMPTPRVQQMAQQIQQLTPQEIGQLLKLAPALRRARPTEKPAYQMNQQAIRDYIQQEVTALGSEYRAMQDTDPFIGGLSVREYFALSDAEQERLWDEQHVMEIDDFEERDVRPNAQISAR